MKNMITLAVAAIFSTTFSFGQTPYLVKDMNPGTESGITWITDFECSDGLYYYMAGDGTAGNELWRSDGTDAGTFMVKNINPNEANVQNVSDIYPFNGGVLFGGEDDVNGKEPWFSDGTEAGTFMLADIELGTLNSIVLAHWAEINGKAVFMAFYESSGQELMVTDGTVAGTGLLKELSTGGLTSSGVIGTGYAAGFVEFQNELYFLGNDSNNDWELWKTDGTSSGTIRVKDINPGTTSGMDTGFNIDQYYIFNNEMYFIADDGTNGVEVWRTDGTDAGTQMLSDINTTGDAYQSGSSRPYFFEYNSELFFIADDGTNGIEIWKTDGSDAGTTMLKNINPGGDGATGPGFINSNGILMFGAEDFNSGIELWKSDGTEAGTEEVLEINPGTSGGIGYRKINFNGSMYFTGISTTDGAELWKTDGTTAGTVMVKDVYPGNWSGMIQVGGMHVVNDLMYYVGSSLATGQELWQTDGSEAGTVCAGEIEAGATGSFPQNLNLKCQNLYFTASTSAEGLELWALNTGWIVGDEELVEEETLLIYPNPSNGEFVIDFGRTIENGNLQILDVNMKTVHSESVSELNKISITSDLSAGTYFVMINDGTSNTVEKVQIF